MGKLSLYSLYQTISNNSTLSGTSNVYSFIDNKGNVTQIKKIKKDRLKHYFDPELTYIPATEDCLIGVSYEESGSCSFGIALGLGDNISTPANY